jgi:hypothetical protein
VAHSERFKVGWLWAMMMFVCDRATDLVDGLSVDPEPSMR